MNPRAEKVMLLIDADNVSVDVMEQALRLLVNQHGGVHVRRAYCTAESALANQAFFKRYGIKPMVNLAAGKNSTDIAMAVDAIDLVIAERPDVVVIASSDSDFAPLVQRVREKGCTVRGIGQMGKVGDETRDVYDDFTVLEHRGGRGGGAGATPARSAARKAGGRGGRDERGTAPPAEPAARGSRRGRERSGGMPARDADAQGAPPAAAAPAAPAIEPGPGAPPPLAPALVADVLSPAAAAAAVADESPDDTRPTADGPDVAGTETTSANTGGAHVGTPDGDDADGTPAPARKAARKSTARAASAKTSGGTGPAAKKSPAARSRARKSASGPVEAAAPEAPPAADETPGATAGGVPDADVTAASDTSAPRTRRATARRGKVRPTVDTTAAESPAVVDAVATSPGTAAAAAPPPPPDGAATPEPAAAAVAAVDAPEARRPGARGAHAPPRDGARPSLGAVLACLPELTEGRPLPLNVAAQRLREAQLLSRSGSSLKLFAAYGERFDLQPPGKPALVRWRG